MDYVYNFQLAATKLLKFDAKGEFYIVEALCRPKKDGASTLLGTTNNHTRMVRMWTFYSVDDFYRMVDEIENVCNANNARAYLLPQRRTTYGAMKSIMANALKEIDCEQVNFNKFITSSLCGMHESPKKRWVLDIDYDDKTLLGYIRAKRVGTDAEHYNIVGKDLMDAAHEVFVNVRQRVEKCGSGKWDDVVYVPTVNGCHIVTPPFNPNECAKIQLPPMSEPFDPKWVKQDAMTLLYAKRYDSEDEQPY